MLTGILLESYKSKSKNLIKLLLVTISLDCLILSYCYA